MEILYFTLGVSAVLVIFMIVGMFIVWKKAVKNAIATTSIWNGIDSLNSDLGQELNRLNLNVDNKIKEVHESVNAIEQNLNGEFNEFQKIIDYRLDKFEIRLTDFFNDECKPTQKK